jgi:hypothetical protein
MSIFRKFIDDYQYTGVPLQGGRPSMKSIVAIAQVPR